MESAFHIRACGRCTGIKSNIRRKELHKTNQSSKFIGRNFSTRDNLRDPISKIKTYGAKSGTNIEIIEL